MVAELPNALIAGERSVAACALASFRDRLFVAWTNNELALNLAVWSAAGHITDKRRLRARTYTTEHTSRESRTVPLAPAFAASADRLHLAWTSPDGTPRVLRVDGDRPPAGLQLRLGGAPALAHTPSGTRFAFTDADRRIVVLTLTDGPGPPPVRLDAARTPVAPAVCEYRDALVVAWTGTDRRVNLVTLTDRGPTAPLRLAASRTTLAPAVCRHRDSVVVAWTDPEEHVHVLDLARGTSTPPLRVDEARSSTPPALCSHSGDLVVGWTGTDRHLNVGRLP